MKKGWMVDKYSMDEVRTVDERWMNEWSKDEWIDAWTVVDGWLNYGLKIVNYFNI